MKRNYNQPFITILIVIIFSLNGTIVNPNTFSQELTKGIEANGGSLVLLEEYTATWCQVCAEIEPDVKELALIHNERVALIALHPADGVDEIGNYASSKRISALFNGSVTSTPTFLLDGKIASKGAPLMSQLNTKILQSQSKKSNFTEIYFSVKRVNESLNFKIEMDSNYDGIVNIMILENKVTSNNYIGDLEKFDNVLKEMISMNLSNNEMITGTSDWAFEINNSIEKILINATYKISGDMNLDNLGFLASHEIIEGDEISVKGAVKIIQGIENANDSSYFLLIFAIILILGVFASLGSLSNNKLNEENE
jgi:thiol-disulfide isomerase/thioredoxin